MGQYNYSLIFLGLILSRTASNLLRGREGITNHSETSDHSPARGEQTNPQRHSANGDCRPSEHQRNQVRRKRSRSVFVYFRGKVNINMNDLSSYGKMRVVVQYNLEHLGVGGN